jgi:hypothetical protein
VRSGQYKKTQQLAQKLYKTHGKYKYIFWSVSSMLHQNDLSPTMLDLAEKMIMKVLSEVVGSTDEPGAEELLLLIEILKRKCNKQNEDSVNISYCLKSLELLTTYTTSQMKSISTDNEVSSNKGTVNTLIDDEITVKNNPSIIKNYYLHILNTKLNLYDQLRAYGWIDNTTTNDNNDNNNGNVLNEYSVIMKILDMLPDQWDMLLKYIQYNLNLYEKNSNDTVLIDTFKSIQLMQNRNKNLRGPYLIELHFINILYNKYHYNISTLLPNYVNEDNTEYMNIIGVNHESVFDVYVAHITLLLSKYITKFESKQCCFSDIKQYLSIIVDDNNQYYNDFNVWLNNRITVVKTNYYDIVNNPDIDVSASYENITHLLLRLSKLLQIQFFVYHTKQQFMSYYTQLFNELILLYKDNIKLCGGRGIGGLRETQPADEILLLCNYILNYIFHSVDTTTANTTTCTGLISQLNITLYSEVIYVMSVMQMLYIIYVNNSKTIIMLINNFN